MSVLPTVCIERCSLRLWPLTLVFSLPGSWLTPRVFPDSAQTSSPLGSISGPPTMSQQCSSATVACVPCPHCMHGGCWELLVQALLSPTLGCEALRPETKISVSPERPAQGLVDTHGHLQVQNVPIIPLIKVRCPLSSLSPASMSLQVEPFPFSTDGL